MYNLYGFYANAVNESCANKNRFYDTLNRGRPQKKNLRGAKVGVYQVCRVTNMLFRTFSIIPSGKDLLRCMGVRALPDVCHLSVNRCSIR